MSKVPWYKQRLKALLFKARFADKVEEIKPVRNKTFYTIFPILPCMNKKLTKVWTCVVQLTLEKGLH